MLSSTADIIFAAEPDLSVPEFRRILAESGLGAMRPMDDDSRLGALLAGADLVVAARRDGDGRLVGLARCITDRAWCCYVADLAVSPEAQGRGVGRGLIDALRRELGSGVAVLLQSVPEAVGFYQHLGMEPLPDTFMFRRTR